MTLDPRITFSRASLGTYYDADGLLKYAAHNYLWPSADFSAAQWSKGAGATVTVDNIAAPDSTLTADRLNHVTAGTVNGAYASQSFSGGQTYIFSAYVKAGTKNWVILSCSTGSPPAASAAWFDLSAGVVGTKGSTWISSGIQSIGSGWYRCWVLGLGSATSGISTIRVAETNGSQNCTSPGDIYIWGAQAENVTTATTPSTYLPTTTAAVHGPRFDYDPVTHVAKGLLIEEARANAVAIPQDLSSGSWAKTGCTISVDQIAAPDGTTTADMVTVSASPSTVSYSAAASGPSYTVSFYVKKGTSDWIYFVGQTTDAPKAWFNVNTMTVGTVQAGIDGTGVQNIGNGWYRCWIIDTATTGTEPATIGICDADNSATVTVGRTVYLWGAQLESAATFPTSYMVGIANRAADVAVMTGTDFSSWYNQPAGTFVAEFDLRSVAPAMQGIISADFGANSNRIFFRTDAGTDPMAFVVTASVVHASLDLGTIAANTVSKIGISYAVNDVAGCFNGGTVGTDTTVPTLPAGLVQLQIGTDTAANKMSGHLRRIRFFNVAKTDAELITLTTLPTAMPVVTLAWTTPDDDTTPSFTVTFTGAAVGDVLQLQVDDDYLFGSLFATESLTLNSTQVAAGTVTMGATIPALSLGVTYNARVRVTR